MVVGGSVAGFRTVTYVGPGDIVSGARAWWGLRAFSNATAGTNAIRLRRSSDSAELDFATLTNGSLDEAGITTWAGGASLFLIKLFDQTGNGQDVTQATTTRQPPFLR